VQRNGIRDISIANREEGDYYVSQRAVICGILSAVVLLISRCDEEISRLSGPCDMFEAD